MTEKAARLPFIDVHERAIGAPAEDVWDALAVDVLPRLGGKAGPLVARILGCSYVRRPCAGDGLPQAIVGFRVAEALRPGLISLEGQHRFSHYSLTFRIEPSGASQSQLSAETRAAFPGLTGSLYRQAVIGSGGHRVAMHRLLAQIARRAESSAAGGSS
ncbi:MAG: hypothetical protein JOZ73_08850 [Solirubrobacterales bacterium]|nr:hypothetical protein [Solirubrobacterales bacterium]